jgi:hypothetical protein
MRHLLYINIAGHHITGKKMQLTAEGLPNESMLKLD